MANELDPRILASLVFSVKASTDALLAYTAPFLQPRSEDPEPTEQEMHEANKKITTFMARAKSADVDQ